MATTTASSDFKKVGDIYCLALIRSLVAAGHAASVTLGLSGVRRSEFGKDVEAYSSELLKPLFMALCDRPWLVAQGVNLAKFVDGFDIYHAMDRAVEFVKVKRRQGVTGISRYDIAAADVGEGLDKAFPQRMSVPLLAPPKAAHKGDQHV